MSVEIAKKYVNALVKSCNEEELETMVDSLHLLSQIYNDKKFINIIESPDVDKRKKEQFVLSLIETKNQKFTNFIKLLNENDRLGFISEIGKELKYQLALKNNQYIAVIYSNFDIPSEKVEVLAKNFSKKFNSDIKLHISNETYPGVKVEIDDLGVEISFSLNRLKTQMAEHILKAI